MALMLYQALFERMTFTPGGSFGRWIGQMMLGMRRMI
jgi:hypothetical protein